MKEITNKTILKQGDKTYQPVEVDGVVYWIDESVDQEPNIWFFSKRLNRPQIAGISIASITCQNQIVAQSQPKLEGIPVVSLDNYIPVKCQVALNYWKQFDGEKQKGIVYGIGLCLEHQKENPNRYTQKDIEEAFLAGSYFKEKWVKEIPLKNSDIVLREPDVEKYLNHAKCISVIEVDEQFNVKIEY
jgi:hypothetical protein